MGFKFRVWGLEFGVSGFGVRRRLLTSRVSLTPTFVSLVKREGPAVQECSLAHNPNPC